MCGLHIHCDGSECNTQDGNVTHICVFHCCCYDNCNIGILWVDAGCHLLAKICFTVPTCRMFVFNFNLKQIVEILWPMIKVFCVLFLYEDARKIFFVFIVLFRGAFLGLKTHAGFQLVVIVAVVLLICRAFCLHNTVIYENKKFPVSVMRIKVPHTWKN